MQEEKIKHSNEEINKLNEKILEANLFTPDHVYIDMTLLKDYNLGIIFTDILLNKKDYSLFEKFQSHLLKVIFDYQKRKFETIEPFFEEFGYNDEVISELLKRTDLHDSYFLMAPSTNFLKQLAISTIVNRNHSAPAHKYTKKYVAEKQYVLEPVSITYYFNIYPLQVSNRILESVGKEIGESFGVDVEFVNKNCFEFDDIDWKKWVHKIQCYYLDSIGSFTGSPLMLKKMPEGETVGKHIFARKRWPKESRNISDEEFETQLQITMVHLHWFSEFEWIMNKQIELEKSKDIVDDSDKVKESNHE